MLRFPLPIVLLVSATLPMRMKPGDTLLSSISVDTLGTIKRVFRTSDDTISPVRSVSVLTCVPDPLPPDAFRPSYCDRDQTVYLSRNLRRHLLRRLSPVPNTPTLAEFEGYLRRPWIDTLFFGFDAPVDYMPDYGREVARVTGIAGLLLQLNHSAEAKEPLLVYLVQYGIDLRGIARAGHPGWPAHGGPRPLGIIRPSSIMWIAGWLLSLTALPADS